jgi:hypothetical protein
MIYFLTKGVWITIGNKTYGFGTRTQLAALVVKRREEQEAPDRLIAAQRAAQWEAKQEREAGAARRKAGTANTTTMGTHSSQ